MGLQGTYTTPVSPLPWICQVCSSLMWLKYGVLVADKMILGVNFTGVALGMYYLAIYWDLTPGARRVVTNRQNLSLYEWCCIFMWLVSRDWHVLLCAAHKPYCSIRKKNAQRLCFGVHVCVAGRKEAFISMLLYAAAVVYPILIVVQFVNYTDSVEFIGEQGNMMVEVWKECLTIHAGSALWFELNTNYASEDEILHHVQNWLTARLSPQAEASLHD